MTQMLIDFPRPIVYPDGFLSLIEYAIYVQQQASFSGVHTQRLDGNTVVEYGRVLPSLILIHEDGAAWQYMVVRMYGRVFFGGRGFREIQLKTAGGYKSQRSMVEITPNFSELTNFRCVGGDFIE